MYDDEIFIIGKPPILLHSKDAGKSWERVPLSPKVCGPKGLSRHPRRVLPVVARPVCFCVSLFLRV